MLFKTFKGNGDTVKGVKTVLLTSEKGSTLESKFFTFRVDHFQKELDVLKSQQKSQVFSLINTVENLPKVSSPLHNL